MLDSDQSLFKDYIQRVNKIDHVNAFTQQYKRRQILQNILQASQTEKTKLYSGHTEKVMYIHPKFEENLPKQRLNLTKGPRSSWVSKTEMSQDENIIVKNSMPFNQRMKAMQKQGIKGYQDTLSRFTKSHEKTDDASHPSIEPQQLYFTSATFKIPILPKIRDRKQTQCQTTEKKKQQREQPKQFTTDGGESFNRYLNSDLHISVKEQQSKPMKKTLSQERKMIENALKKQRKTPQRPVTKRTKMFDQMIQNFNFKEHFLEDNQKDVDDFYNYVRSYKKQR